MTVYAASRFDRYYLRWRFVFAVTLTLSLMGVSGLIMAAVRIIALGRARNFCSNHIAPVCARIILLLIGIRYRYFGLEEFPKHPCVYIANHPSSLDLLLIPAMGLPNSRMCLGRKTRSYLPLWLCGAVQGTFYVPPQSERENRVKCFQRVAEVLRRTGESVFLTPEGTRSPDGVILPFNKGAFHLAMSLGVPIVPIYIHVPSEINPGRGLVSRPGVIDIHVHAPISTQDWKLDDIDQIRETMHALYAEFPRSWPMGGDTSKRAA